MNQEILNRVMIPQNICFGCGHDNPSGLKIEVVKDGENSNSLIGIFHPQKEMIGFPGITHGGLLYTAMDCMAAWVPTALRRDIKAIWILRSASMTYHQASKTGEPVHLKGVVEEEGKPWESMVIRVEAKNPREQMVAEGKFKVIPLPPEKFLKVAGIDQVPENLTRILGPNS